MTAVKDYKKEYKDFYSPKLTPGLVEIPEMCFVAVNGQGKPNVPDGEYQKAIEVLYTIQYTIKMSKKGETVPAGYFDYVVPPLESLWWLSDNTSDFKDKSKYQWTAMILLPEFVTKDIFKWACMEAEKKKKISTEKAYLLKYRDGLCIQCLHIGSYNDEPKTLALMDNYIKEQNLKQDVNDKRRHHEIYLLGPTKAEESKMKTILRVPVKK
jgi:hypothetical protein